MPIIPFQASGFPAPYVAKNGWREMAVPWPFLLWAAISVGRAELAHIVRYGQFSLFEIAYRSAIIFANLCDDGNGGIRRSAAYDALDPSEKGAISYFVGLTVAKAFAEAELCVPWLMHLDVYRQELQPVFAGQGRPDLVGQTTSGDWVVIEAKGRTRGLDQGALGSAKDQAAAIETVQEQAPVLKIGMVTHFASDRLQFTADDPPSDRSRGDGVRLPLTREKLLDAYYRPFRQWLAHEPLAREDEIEGTKYRMASVQTIDVTIGLEVDLIEPGVEHARERRWYGQEYKAYAGSDGVLVMPGGLWSPSNMLLEPQARSLPPSEGLYPAAPGGMVRRSG